MQCPQCQAWLAIPDPAATRVRCGLCQAVVDVGPLAQVDVLEVVDTHAPRRAERKRDEDDENLRPLRRSNRDKDDEGEDGRSDRSRARSREDTEDDQPRRQRRVTVPEDLLERGRELSVPLGDLSRELQTRIEQTVTAKETIVYVGQPDPKVTAWRALPLVVVGGIFFAIATFFVILGIVLEFIAILIIGPLFMLIGGLLMLGPLWARLFAKRTVYVLTSHRAIVIRHGLLFGLSAQTYNRREVGRMRKQRSWFVANAGDLVMHQEIHVHVDKHGVGHSVSQYGFMSLRDLDAVCDLMRATLLEEED